MGGGGGAWEKGRAGVYDLMYGSFLSGYRRVGHEGLGLRSLRLIRGFRLPLGPQVAEEVAA